MIDTNFFVKKAEFNLAQIAEICGAALQNADRGGEMIRDINTMDKAGEGEICFSMIARKKLPAPKSRLRPALPPPNWRRLWLRRQPFLSAAIRKRPF